MLILLCRKIELKPHECNVNNNDTISGRTLWLRSNSAPHYIDTDTVSSYVFAFVVIPVSSSYVLTRMVSSAIIYINILELKILLNVLPIYCTCNFFFSSIFYDDNGLLILYCSVLQEEVRNDAFVKTVFYHIL